MKFTPPYAMTRSQCIERLSNVVTADSILQSLKKIALILFILGSELLGAQVSARKALVIGNNSYGGRSFPPLGGVPIKDADAIFRVLSEVGFDKKDITVADDVDKAAFIGKLIDFRNNLNPEDSVLFYFSGHGFSIDDSDYLVPIDFTLGKTKKAARDEAVSLAQVVSYLVGARTRIIILDACRTDTPTLKEMVNNSERSFTLDGLTVAPGEGTLIAYATSSNHASSAQSSSGLSLYTQYLVDSLRSRPATMEIAIDNAKAMTFKGSNGSQAPATYNEMLGGSFQLSGSPSSSPTPVSKVPSISYRVDNSPLGRIIALAENGKLSAIKGKSDEAQTWSANLSLPFSGHTCVLDGTDKREGLVYRCDQLVHSLEEAGQNVRAYQNLIESPGIQKTGEKDDGKYHNVYYKVIGHNVLITTVLVIVPTSRDRELYRTEIGLVKRPPDMPEE